MEKKYQTIFDSVYLFEEALSFEETNYFLSLYEENKDTIYTPVLSSGRSMSLQMTCLGKHWNPKTYQYSVCREDYDQQTVQEFPLQVNQILAKFLIPFQNQYKAEWDIGIMNVYNSQAKLGLHIDNSESIETMLSGHPIISLSFGASCVFRIGGFSRFEEYQDIVLNSGDVLIFGGPSRMRYHSVLKISKNDEQKFSVLPPTTRLNFTFRKF